MAECAFAVIDTQTGHEEADKYNEKFQLPPVIGLPVMLCMQEIQLDFAHREIIIPAIPTPNPLGKSNLIRTDTEGLQLKTPDETGNHVYFHFDTGCYYTYMQPTWYNRHKKKWIQPVYQIHFVWQELEEYQLPALISCRI